MSASTCGSVTRHPCAMNVRRSARSVAYSVGDSPSSDSGSFPRNRARIQPSNCSKIPELSRNRVKATGSRRQGPLVECTRSGQSVTYSEQAELVGLDAAQLVVIQCEATDSAVLGQSTGLRLDDLRREHTRHRRQQRVAVQEFEIPGQLLDAVDFATALDLHRDRATVTVAGHDVDRADCGGKLAADQGIAVAEGLDVLGEQFLQVRLHAVLLQARFDAEFPRVVVEDLFDADDELLAL